MLLLSVDLGGRLRCPNYFGEGDPRGEAGRGGEGGLGWIGMD